MLNYVILILILAALVFAGRRAIRDLRSSRCAGCSGCKEPKKVNITLKKGRS